MVCLSTCPELLFFTIVAIILCVVCSFVYGVAVYMFVMYSSTEFDL